MDIVDRKRRSAIMARIGPKDTVPELAVRRMAHALGFRFRLHRKDLPGRPDLVFPALGLCVFVHGCFWHQHAGCRNCTSPKSNTAFWHAKLVGNVERDHRTVAALIALGWRVAVIWECEAEDQKALKTHLNAILGPLRDARAAGAIQEQKKCLAKFR